MEVGIGAQNWNLWEYSIAQISMEIWKCNVSFFLSPEEHQGHRRCPLPIRSQSAFEEVTSAGGNTQVGQVHISEHHTVVQSQQQVTSFSPSPWKTPFWWDREHVKSQGYRVSWSVGDQ